MFVEAIIAGVVTAKLREGTFNALKRVNLKWVSLIIAALFIEVFVPILYDRGFTAVKDFIMPIQIVQYGLTFAFVYYNLRYSSMLVIGAGSFLNFIVIIVNGGKMPVSRSVINGISQSSKLAKLVAGDIPNYTVVSETTLLAFLGDVIPYNLFVKSLLSIGDIVLCIGLFLLVQQFMRSKPLFQTSEREQNSL